VSYEDSVVTDALNRTLQDEKPGTRARDLIPQHTRRLRGRGRGLALVAAGITLCLLTAALTVPAVARAIGDSPWLGDSYQMFLKGTGMDIAYQAGLVNELNRSDTKGDFTFTVIAAYADATQSIIVFQLSSDDPARIEELWEDSISIFPHFYNTASLFSPNLSGGGSMNHIPEEGIIFGIYHTDPPGWSLFGRKLRTEVKSLGLSVTFPLQTISSNLNERVAVNKDFVYDGLQCRVEEIIFSPSATQVVYSRIGGDPRPWDKEAYWEWSLRTIDGTELISYSGSFSNGKGMITFPPTDNSEVAILIKGYFEMYDYEGVLLPLGNGSSVVTPVGELIIDTSVSTGTETEVTLVWSGEGSLAKPSISLVDSQGNRGEVSNAELTAEGIKLNFQHGVLIGPVQLEINAVQVYIQEEIEITQVYRKK